MTNSDGEMETNQAPSSSANNTPGVIAAQTSNIDPNFLFAQQNANISAQLNGPWSVVKNKRKHSPFKKQSVQKQQKLTNYWLGADETQNRFNALETDEEVTPPVVVVVPKPPPIFIDCVEKIVPLRQLLNEIAKDSHEMKAMGNNRIRVQPKTAENYSKIVKALEEKKTQFHTYELKENRAFRVVLKNVHHTTDTEELKEVLGKLGHVVRNIHNIKKRVTKEPLPMFYVDLEPRTNNIDIYKVELIMNLRVKFEPPKQYRELPQCMQCQRYGHTKRFCHHSPRCVKCAGNHPTTSCSRKVKDNNVLCVLCDLNHPANYKGCSVYKELQKISFPSLRDKDNGNDKPNQQETKSAHVRPGMSYAQAAREESQQTQFINNLQQSQTNKTRQSNDMSELKKMMKTLMEQMGTMLNLLTTLVSKMK